MKFSRLKVSQIYGETQWGMGSLEDHTEHAVKIVLRSKHYNGLKIVKITCFEQAEEGTSGRMP